MPDEQVIGFCSGGRQAYMMACKLDIDAAVDCWGYEGAGHGFFAVDRANYRPQQAVDGWKKVFAFFERTLKIESREPALASGRA